MRFCHFLPLLEKKNIDFVTFLSFFERVNIKNIKQNQSQTFIPLYYDILIIRKPKIGKNKIHTVHTKRQ